jgi:hypothetical protein
VRAPPPEGDGQEESRARRGDVPSRVLDPAADDDLHGHETENARQPLSPAREGLPAACQFSADVSVSRELSVKVSVSHLICR